MSIGKAGLARADIYSCSWLEEVRQPLTCHAEPCWYEHSKYTNKNYIHNQKREVYTDAEYAFMFLIADFPNVAKQQT